MEQSKRPSILAAILEIFGAITIAVGVLVALVFGMGGIGFWGTLWGILVIVGITLFNALIYFGIAQVIRDINRTANNTERMARVEMALSKLTKQLESKASASREWEAPRQQSAASTGEGYFYYDGTTQLGPFTLADMRDFFSSGVIDEDTQVSGSGLQSWAPLKSTGNLFAKVKF